MTESPAIPVTETPEFKEALRAMRDEILSDIRKSLPGSVPANVDNEEARTLFRQMAMSIAEISDQGTNRKRVAPEILAAREEAQHKMGELILKSRKLPDHEKPVYRLVAKVYLKERLIEPLQRRGNTTVPTEIRWTNAPNAAMRPRNEAAREIYAEFLKWIGGSGTLTGLAKAPTWVTNSGAVLLNSPHGADAGIIRLDPPEDVDLGSDEADDFAELTADDPSVPDIHVLGTVAAPARKMSLGERRV